MRIQNTPIMNRQQHNPKANLAFGCSRTKLGYSIDEFVKIKEPSKNVVEEFLQKINTFIKESCSPQNRLGKGEHASVFKIDDKYVIKIGKEDAEKAMSLVSQGDINFRELKTYYGAPVLKLDRFSNIMNNVSSTGSHTPVGVTQAQCAKMTIPEIQQNWSEVYLPKFAKLPQESFDALAKDFATLNKMGKDGTHYQFDALNPSNFVLVGDSSLRIVDDIDITKFRDSNSTSDLLYVFLKKINMDYDAPNDLLNRGLRQELLKKIILAGEKNELPFMSDNYLDSKTWQYVCDDFCDYKEITEGLKSMRRSYPDIKERIQKVDKFLDETLNAPSYSSYFDYY